MEELRFHEDTSIQEMLYSVYNIEPKGWVLLPVRKFTEVLNISEYQVRKELNELMEIEWVYSFNGLPFPAPYRGGYRLTESGYNDITDLIKEVYGEKYKEVYGEKQEDDQ